MSTRCFWLEPTDRVQQSLRVFLAQGDACPGRMPYHQAIVLLDEAPAIWTPHPEGGRPSLSGQAPQAAADDPRWPTKCEACGAVLEYGVSTDVRRQHNFELIYRRQDTGETMTIAKAPPGAMWDAHWYGTPGPDGRTLVVRLPDGTDWLVDGPASNCKLALGEGRPHGKYCWERSGIPPDVTVRRGSCSNCGVGGGSIGTPRYHGYLTAGYITET